MLPVLPSSPSPKINSLSYSKFSYVHRVSKVFAFRRLVPSLQNTPVFEKEKKKKTFVSIPNAQRSCQHLQKCFIKWNKNVSFNIFSRDEFVKFTSRLNKIQELHKQIFLFFLFFSNTSMKRL